MGQPDGCAARSRFVRPRGSLNIIGVGYRISSQVTPEALACVRKADRLFHLVYDPVTEAWLNTIHAEASSLAECWIPEKPALECCEAMVGRIMSAVRKNLNVCAAFSGHPGICVHPTREAGRRARNEGFEVRMIPGVSAVDCLFADAGIDPGQEGCRIFETGRFLITRPRLDPAVSLVLLQPGDAVDGVIEKRLRSLSGFLQRAYAPNHPVLVYETSTFPGARPLMHWTRLAMLPRAPVSPLSTLFFPTNSRRR